MSIKNDFIKCISNLPGWKTKRKIVVFESDDWGSIRMPSKKVYEKLYRQIINIEETHYNLYDSLESNKDLECLFEVLSSFKDSNGNNPVFTAVCVLANPDFAKIKESNFETYYFEPFTETLKQYPAHDKVFDLWKEGINSNLFIPQFHGREHLNVKRWLRDLQNGNRDALFAFENKMWGISSPLIKKTYQAGFDIDQPSDIEYLKTVINDGLDIFSSLLGYESEYFVPTNGFFNHTLMPTLGKKGIKYVMLDKLQREPLGNNKYKTRLHYLGLKNKQNITFMSRNGLFEPSSADKDWVDSCLHDIEFSFNMHKPATISTHRVNYIGYLDAKNRDKNLRLLNHLISRIIKKWPNVEFMTSAELGSNIVASQSN